MDKFFALIISILFFTAITLVFNGNAFGQEVDTCNYKNYTQVDNQVLLAACPDCEICGRDIEIMADRHFKSGDKKAAIKSYVRAIKIYKQELKFNPRNRCIKTGLNRTEGKLKLLLNNK